MRCWSSPTSGSTSLTVDDVTADPLYPVEMWSVRERTLDGKPRTTNNLEGYLSQPPAHSGHQARAFIQVMQRETVVIANEIKRLSLGFPPRRTRLKTDILRDERVHRITERFEESEPKGFLRAISHNILFLLFEMILVLIVD